MCSPLAMHLFSSKMIKNNDPTIHSIPKQQNPALHFFSFKKPFHKKMS